MPVLPIEPMDSEAIASLEADAWQNLADAASARMRRRYENGFCTVQLNAADAATVQVGSQHQAAGFACLPLAAQGAQRVTLRQLRTGNSMTRRDLLCRQPSRWLLRRWTLSYSWTTQSAQGL